MRVLFAAIFVFSSGLGVVSILESYFGCNSPWWSRLLPAASMLLAVALSLFVFNRSDDRPRLRHQSLDKYLAELEAKGNLLSQQYQAIRSFAVEELEDEGSHYYLELADGRVLYLSGQYLYDYKQTSDDSEINQNQPFPCTEFEILRHRDTGDVIHIRCAGSILKPEIVVSPFTHEDFKRGIPEDGEIIESKSYEQLKGELTATQPFQRKDAS